MEKSVEFKNNIHENHRSRMLEQIENVGFESLTDVQALEFILQYIFTRIDTNPIAHRLLKRFGSISAVLDADIFSLMEVEGMGRRSAKLLVLFPKIFEKYNLDKVKSIKFLNTFQDLSNYCYALLRSKPKEEIFAICLNAQNKVLDLVNIGKGSELKVFIDEAKIYKTFMKYPSMKKVALTHNHPDSDSKPSVMDKITTDKCTIIFQKFGVNLRDHVIVGLDGCYFLNKAENINPNET